MDELAAHKHVHTTQPPRCIVVTVERNTQRAFVDGQLLHTLEVAHAELALRFVKKTMDDHYPGGIWLDGRCPEHPIPPLAED